MRRRLVLLVLVVTACSQPASPATSPTTAATPTADLPLKTVGFPCRLPVMKTIGNEQYAGGFIVFPAATYEIDPDGILHTAGDGSVVTDAVPILKGAPGTTFYDRRFHRWVPSSEAASRPDGVLYAYATVDESRRTQAVVHVVDVGTGMEKVLKVTLPIAALEVRIIDFDEFAVYLVIATNIEQLPLGVWRVDVSTGATRRVQQVDGVAWVRTGMAWLAGIDPRDPAPPVLGRSGTPSDSLVLVNLVTGSRATWFYRPGKQVDLMGVGAGGLPVVRVSDPNVTSEHEIWLATGPGANGSRLYSGPLELGSPLGDGDRIWFASESGIYLYTADTGVIKVAAFKLQLNESMVPAGFCR